jgi:hypothetical protein
MAKLARFLPAGTYDAVDFQQPGALDRFPQLTYDECMKAMKLVMPNGRVFSGAEAAARAVTLRKIVGVVGWGYYVPGVRQILDAVYARTARRRYELMARDCESGACKLHASP